MPNKKQDPKEVAKKQRYEVVYIAKKFGIQIDLVKEIRSAVGKSRRKIYAEIRNRLGVSVSTNEPTNITIGKTKPVKIKKKNPNNFKRLKK